MNGQWVFGVRGGTLYITLLAISSYFSPHNLPEDSAGVASSDGVVVGTSLIELGAGVSDILTEEASVEEGRSDSMLEEIIPDGVGVADGCRDALS